MIYVKEKILLYGGSNSGKTHAALLFAQAIIAGGKRAFVIDADDGAMKLIAEMDEFGLLRDALGNQLQIATAYGYDTALAAVTQFTHKFKPTQGDVVVLEMIGNPWEWAQAEFTNTVKHESPAQVQLDQAEKGRIQFGGLEGKSEWPIIKRLYFDLTTPTLQTPAHVIWTSGAKDLVDALEKIDIMDMFGSVRQKNEGQGGVHYKVDTVIHVAYDRKNQVKQDDGKMLTVPVRRWTSLKDRGKRSLVSRVPYVDLFAEYYALHDIKAPWATA